MRYRLRNFIPALLVLAACNTAPKQPISTTADSPQTAPAELPDSLQFAAFYTAFEADLHSTKSLEQLKKYVHPKQGFWIIEANGAMPEFTHYSLLNPAALNKSIKIVHVNNSTCDLKFEPLPLVDCDKPTLYSKDGCFAQKINTFAQHKIWLSAGLQIQERDAIASLANTIQYTLIQTSGFRYYFSKIDTVWYISFIDLRRPCGA
jgi:hypothetical protein